jgi:hypothetical protein
LGAEGFSCSLAILYGGLGISELQFLINKSIFSIFFPQFFVIQTLDPDPDPDSLEMLDPESYPDLNESGFTALFLN